MDSIKEFWSDRSQKQKTFIIVVAVLAFLSILGSLNPESSGSSGNVTSATADSNSKTFETAGCLRVSQELIDSIGQGFQGSQLTGNAAGYTASDFADVRFVAVEFIPNGDSQTQTAVFATNDDDLSNVTLNGLIVPVDGFAKQFSDWGVAPKLNLSITDAGAKEAIECLNLPGAGIAQPEAAITGFDEAKFIATAKSKYGIVEETYDDGSKMTVMGLARTICEVGNLSEMKQNLGSSWSSSFNKFAIETLCPEKLQ